MAIFLTACQPTPSHYASEEPKLDFMTYFTGKVDGWGVVYDWRGRITHRFHVLMDGKQKDNFLRLDETFTYSDGSIIERYWEVTRTGNDSYTAQAPEVPGGATGTQSGNAIQWKYSFDLPYSGRTIRVRMDDWMWLVDENILVNRNKVTKFGIPVGELVIFFRKPAIQS